MITGMRQVLTRVLRQVNALLVHLSYRQLRRLAVLVVGCSVVLVGLAMVVLPGPAVVVIPLGLGILGLEFEWARRLLRRARDGMQSVRYRGRSRAGETPQPPPATSTSQQADSPTLPVDPPNG